MTLGNKIRNRRVELGLTQIELAERTKLTQPTISRIEEDKITPKATTLIALAIYLDLSPNAFLTEERRAS